MTAYTSDAEEDFIERTGEDRRGGRILLQIVNILALAATAGALGWFGYVEQQAHGSAVGDYEIIRCADAKGVIHRCVRIEPSAGEVNNAQTGASYRVIFGQ